MTIVRFACVLQSCGERCASPDFKENEIATQTFEDAGFRFVAGDEYTINGQRGREWIAQRLGDGYWIREMAAHMPLRATRKEIVNEFDTLGLFD